MAQELAFRFAVVLAVAVIILVVMTSATPPRTANDAEFSGIGRVEVKIAAA
jgi:hypothetical protein